MKKVFLFFLLVLNFTFGAGKNYYHFEGKIGSLPVTMDVNVLENYVNATYSYDKFGEIIPLFGSLEKGKLILSDNNEGENFEGIITNNKFEGTWKMGAKALKFSLVENYKNSLSLEELKNLNMNPISLSTTNDNFTRSTSVSYNKNGIAVAEEYTYVYSGGAHGNYGVNYRTYDKKFRKLISFYDFFDEDAYDSLLPLIEKEIKNRDIFTFDDSVFVTENVYFTEKGIMFVYNPYEIASYAQGIISIFLSYEKIPKNLILNNEITKKIIK